MQRFGYHGAVMHVDLGAGYAEIDEPADTFWRQYGGGGLLAATYLMRLTPPGIDSLEPANALIVTSSVMAGQPYVGLARCTVAAKSPMTGGMGETRCDGPFAAALKGSGVDTLVIQGQADRPLLLLIENGHASFADASALWGLPVSQTVDRLEEMFGAGIHTAVIGPAGETLVRFASIVTDRAYQAPRMGMGRSWAPSVSRRS